MNTLEWYQRMAFQSAIRCQPDCRNHYLEPYKSAYASGYDAGEDYRKREGINFFDAKAAIAFRIAEGGAE